MIYTILLGIICLTIMMYIFDIQMSEVEYSASNKKHILKEDNYQRDKEYLMTLFFTYINENKEKMKTDGTTKVFNDSTGDIPEYKIIEYDTAKAIYSKKTNELIIKTVDQYRTTRNDYFKLEIIDEKFQIIFIETEYIYKI
ncbi:hypothetical protein K2F40_00595 [Clostridium sp. CM028]|uniref:hypothetical protein n=1 Tax=unclassified Clostridium TaxID=2614128 RepID=UPI001C6F1297|nr:MULTISPECIES: hypothetical protein [unclassified Clostridium]MBW9144196.1 hypothetical protein [Clostridium sp. CM027]MBW9147494.1 hypothetical protein [Clostridium sp. CM028]WAG70160.1 hypothetical protein LL036_01530 [Clostridium sp. CF011]WLC61831.1 hypothetical protein KTC94_00595 [Clostridium sp. CM028]